MHKPESILESETYKIVWDFDTLTDHRIPSRKPDLVLITKKKRTYYPCDHLYFWILLIHFGRESFYEVLLILIAVEER